LDRIRGEKSLLLLDGGYLLLFNRARARFGERFEERSPPKRDREKDKKLVSEYTCFKKR
jgi:hypothetical protein